MAFRDVKKYYIEVQNQYFEMLENAKDFDEALKAGLVDQAQFDQAKNYLDRLKENYDRLTYIMFLFNKPHRNKKISQDNVKNKDFYAYLEENNATSKKVIDDNTYVLKEFKKFVEDIKKEK